MLLITPALGVAFASGGFTYKNPGERTYLNVTNNQANFTFAIYAGFWNASQSLPIVVNGTDISVLFNITYIGGFYDLTNFNATTGMGTAYWNSTISPGVRNVTGYFEATNTTANILEGLESTYLITGAGNHDLVNLTSGMTNDIYSIVTPGVNDTVNLFTGAGSATFAVQVGVNSTITISPTIVNASTGSTNVFNIVYGNNGY